MAFDARADAVGFFNDAVRGAAETRGYDPNAPSAVYVAGLLADYAKPEFGCGEVLQRPLALLLREALDSSGGERFRRLRGLGDQALYVSGFFAEHLERRGVAQGLAERLEQVSLTFSARVGEEGKLFGSVTTADIAQQLEAQGFQIEKRQVDLHEPIKALGVYRIPIRLHADVKPEVRVWVIKQ